MYVLEVSEDGTLIVPAERLGGAKPRTRFRIEDRNGGLFLSEAEQPKALSPDEWLAEWDGLSRAIDAASTTDRSAVDILSEMRR